MSVSIKADPRELERLKKRIDSILEISAKPQLLLMQLGQGIIQQTQARIEYEKAAPSGQKWAPWSANYAATREPGDSLLIDSRELQDSFQKKVSRNQLAIWTDIEYAGAHQFGVSENNLPARPFLGFSEENLRNIDDWLASILLGGVRGAKVQQTTRKKVKGRGKR